MTDPTEAVVAAVTATAEAISAFGDHLPTPFGEKGMQALFVAALESSIVEGPGSQTVKPGFSLKLKEWPGVGPVDVSVIGESGYPTALLELKWGGGKLYNCVWDLEKLAVTLATRTSHFGFLVAGAPAADWAGALGSELFHADEWLTTDLLHRYEKHWSFWRKDVKCRPLQLPEVVRTRKVASAALWGGAELRCVQVLVPVDDWIDLDDANLKLARLRHRLTWSDGEVDILTPAEAAQALGFTPSPDDQK